MQHPHLADDGADTLFGQTMAELTTRSRSGPEQVPKI